MKMQFTLTMEDLKLVGQDIIDFLSIAWIQDLTKEEVFEASYQWVSSSTFLEDNMTGLIQVGESSLTIAPIEESPHLPSNRLRNINFNF